MERRFPVFSHVPPGTSLMSFTSVTVNDITSTISCLPDKSLTADLLSVLVMKLCTDEIVPFLTELFNHSMSNRYFPSTFKEAFITPAIKKPRLNVISITIYIYYLSGLLPSPQSGVWPGNSTETAMLRILSDLLQAVDSGDVAALVLLDLSAAFDTVDHAILCWRLLLSFGLDGSALK